jgi:hypothetical protein
MTTIAAPALIGTKAVVNKPRRTRRAIAVGALSAGLVAGVAVPAVQAVPVPGTKGTEFWYSAVIYNGRPYTAGNLRYSWSHMWWLKNNIDTISAFSVIACSGLTRAPSVACAALVTAYMTYMKGQINTGISTKRCLEIRFGMPPLGAVQVSRIRLVSCTI